MFFNWGAVVTFFFAKAGETWIKGVSHLMCLGLVSRWRRWPNLPVSGYNECHPGPQQVLHCCMGPGIIWIGACAIAICPSPPPLPQSLPTATLVFTNTAAHLRGKTLARAPVTPLPAFRGKKKKIFWSWTHFCRQISQSQAFSSPSLLQSC